MTVELSEHNLELWGYLKINAWSVKVISASAMGF